MPHPPGRPTRWPGLLTAIILSLPYVSAQTNNRAATHDPLGFESRIRPVLEKHCYECHGRDKIKGGIDFSLLTGTEAVLKFGDRWTQVRDVLDFEDMPPKPKKSGWTDDDRASVMDWIKSTIENPDPGNPLYINPGPPFLRQLTITEYTRTIRDLLGITVNVSELTGIYPDPPVTGFSTYAQGVTMDAVQFDKFYRASEFVIGQLFSEENQPWAKAPDRDAREREASLARGEIFAPAADQKDPTTAARSILLTLVRRAYRRPVQVREIARFENLFQSSLAAGDSLPVSLRKAMMPILVSPSFIYRFEFNPGKLPPGATSHLINDHELAVRLSYFLWSSMPDDTLYQLASAGQLSDLKVYREQVLRMLKDPRASALSEVFASEWTHLAKLREALPNPQIYPEFTDEMKASMRGELIAFFNDLRLANRSIINLIDSDYVFADENLAKLYELPGKFGPGFSRVQLPSDVRRGGLLGMGAILALTSHVDRTKPTARGEWVLATILGEPPPPPPAAAGRFEPPQPDQEPPRDFREKLARHSSDPACMSCHKKIDPLGFSLEDYNPIGAWRDPSNDGPIDNLGTLPDGKKILGITELKTHLLDHQRAFTRNLFGQMLSYAIGRELQYYDQLVVNKAAETIRSQGHTFQSLILAVTESYPFRNRSVSKVAAPSPP